MAPELQVNLDPRSKMDLNFAAPPALPTSQREMPDPLPPLPPYNIELYTSVPDRKLASIF